MNHKQGRTKTEEKTDMRSHLFLVQLDDVDLYLEVRSVGEKSKSTAGGIRDSCF